MDDTACSGAQRRPSHRTDGSEPGENACLLVETPGFDQPGGRPEYPAVFPSDGAAMITHGQAVDPETAVPFDRKNVPGLHQTAFGADDQNTLADITQGRN